ncbi:MAG: amino acid ABC transporter permease, partial [Vulcanimicrobiaceae bacterium]
RWTILLSAIAFVGGGIAGFGIMLLRISDLRVLRGVSIAYIDVLQGTPLLMQLFLCFFGISLIGLEVSPLVAASIALTAYTSAYLAEIWRGCVDAIPKGQREAAESLGFGFIDTLRYVILPQAVRIAVPPTVGFSVQVVKGTALASIIGFVELTKAGTIITNATYKPFLVYGFVAIIYFVLCYPLSVWSRSFERSLRAAH